MRSYEGYVTIKVGFDIPDDYSDLELEQAFNESVTDAWNMGHLYDYDYTEVDV